MMEYTDDQSGVQSYDACKWCACVAAATQCIALVYESHLIRRLSLRHEDGSWLYNVRVGGRIPAVQRLALRLAARHWREFARLSADHLGDAEDRAARIENAALERIMRQERRRFDRADPLAGEYIELVKSQQPLHAAIANELLWAAHVDGPRLAELFDRGWRS